MLVILSPAKTLDYQSPLPTQTFTQPQFSEQAHQLVEILRDYDVDGIRKLMSVSEKIATLNVDRYESYEPEFSTENARQALLTFNGDSYIGFDLESYSEEDFAYAQDHLRTLSGLYGLLRPLDLMQPYRLEMGTKLPNPKGKNLYQFWGTQIADALNEALEAQGDDILVNLASNEYFKSVDRKALKATVVQPVFRDYKKGEYKLIAIYAKKARGFMADWILRSRAETIDDLKQFTGEGYVFSPSESTDTELVYLRKP
ncbi:MAG: peroxide stress protein YaaA [Deltaproteobacteria bacterium]|nr:MAG: peroxide stress protein YaaA [Deltaproteobacteria bacterium]